jgi:hypothetical protein
MGHCPLCDAVTLLLDGTVERFDDGLRSKLAANTGPLLDIQSVAEQLDAQRTHILAHVAIWWVGQSLRLFKGDLAPIEQCLANAFLANGITLYEPTTEKPA